MRLGPGHLSERLRFLFRKSTRLDPAFDKALVFQSEIFGDSLDTPRPARV